MIVTPFESPRSKCPPCGLRHGSAAVCRAAIALAALAALLLQSGCGLVRWIGNGFEVGPDYVEPETEVASQWIDYEDPRVASEEVDLRRWWGIFEDPALDALVGAVYEQNLTLKAAAERVAGARARRNIAFGFLFPQEQEAFGGFSYENASKENANLLVDDSFTVWDLGLGIGWELDFWGRFRRAVEAADAELDASMADYDDVLVILLSEVATQYVLFRTFQERLDYARKNVVIQEGSYEITSERFRLGAIPERHVFEARQILEQTRALIPGLEAGLRQANNALCLLQGLAPQDLAGALGDSGSAPMVEPNVAVGIPADLVRRRPDLRRAERQAAAQSAAIGIAEAEFYPRFSVFGTIGLEAEHLNRLFTSDAVAGSVGPSFQWNILHYGRLLNNVRAQEAGFRELALEYQEAVLRAGKEVEDALHGFLKAYETSAYLAASTAAARRVLEIANEQFAQGAIDYTTVYIFQGALTEQEDRLAVAHGEIGLNLIRLYRALGGGWEMRLDADSTSRDG